MNGDKTGDQAGDLGGDDGEPLDRSELAGALDDARARSEAGCAEPATWHALAVGELASGPAGELRVHAAACPACAAELRLAELFETPAASEGPSEHEVARVVDILRRAASASGARPALRRARAGAWLAAAAALGLLGSGLLLLRDRNAAPPVGGPGDGAVVRGAQIELESPVGDQAAWPEAFRWRGGPPASEYLLSVRRVDGELVFERRVAGDRLVLDDALRALLLPEVTYRWEVRARDEEGRWFARSPIAEFSISP